MTMNWYVPFGSAAPASSSVSFLFLLFSTSSAIQQFAIIRQWGAAHICRYWKTMSWELYAIVGRQIALYNILCCSTPSHPFQCLGRGAERTLGYGAFQDPRIRGTDPRFVEISCDDNGWDPCDSPLRRFAPTRELIILSRDFSFSAITTDFTPILKTSDCRVTAASIPGAAGACSARWWGVGLVGKMMGSSLEFLDLEIWGMVWKSREISLMDEFGYNFGVLMVNYL